MPGIHISSYEEKPGPDGKDDHGHITEDSPMGQQQDTTGSQPRNIYTNVALPDQEKDEEGHLLQHYPRNKVSVHKRHKRVIAVSPATATSINMSLSTTAAAHHQADLYELYANSSASVSLDPNGEIYPLEFRSEELVLSIPQHREHLLRKSS